MDPERLRQTFAGCNLCNKRLAIWCPGCGRPATLTISLMIVGTWIVVVGFAASLVPQEVVPRKFSEAGNVVYVFESLQNAVVLTVGTATILVIVPLYFYLFFWGRLGPPKMAIEEHPYVEKSKWIFKGIGYTLASLAAFMVVAGSFLLLWKDPTENFRSATLSSQSVTLRSLYRDYEIPYENILACELQQETDKANRREGILLRSKIVIRTTSREVRIICKPISVDDAVKVGQMTAFAEACVNEIDKRRPGK